MTHVPYMSLRASLFVPCVPGYDPPCASAPPCTMHLHAPYVAMHLNAPHPACMLHTPPYAVMHHAPCTMLYEPPCSMQMVKVRHISVTHVSVDPMQRSELTQLKLERFSAAIVLCDERCATCINPSNLSSLPDARTGSREDACAVSMVFAPAPVTQCGG